MIKFKIKKNNNKKGVALLFTVMLSSILLVVALSISNIATKESVFSTSVRNSNDAFFAADTGAECALANDKTGGPFDLGGDILCNDNTSTIIGSSGDWSFEVVGMGSSGNACAKVFLTRDTTTNPLIISTKIISKGYNSGTDGEACHPIQSNVVERELEVNYEQDAPAPPTP